MDRSVKIPMTTQTQFDDYVIVETIGIVRGNTIRARHIGNDILAGLKSIIGGEIGEYTKMMAEAREQAIDRMIADAVMQGATGIVAVRFTTSTILQGAAELLAYGTAVKIKPK
ncbi:MAG TPA: YbjQ family protein [Anaerolineae bacterium]|nr:YbjQ family protein [Anaerolineae bacterium]